MVLNKNNEGGNISRRLKSSIFDEKNNNTARASRLFGTFRCPHFTPTVKFPFSRFMNRTEIHNFHPVSSLSTWMWALKLLLKKNVERHRFDNLRNDQTSMITRTGATAIFLFVHVEKQGNDLFYRLVEWKKVCNTRPLRVKQSRFACR